MKFIKGSIVCVISQPEMQKMIPLVGEIGFVDDVEIERNACLFQVVTQNGQRGGMGWVNADSLSDLTDPVLRQIVWGYQVNHKANMDKLIRKSVEITGKINSGMMKIAAKNKLSIDQLHRILSDVAILKEEIDP